MITVQKRVPFDACDMAGVLFYGSIFTLAHQVLETVLLQIGIPWSRWFEASEGAPIRRVECDYLRPMRGSEVYDVDVSFTSFTNSSFKEVYVFKKEGVSHCQLSIIKVFINRKKREKIPIPADILKILKAV